MSTTNSISDALRNYGYDIVRKLGQGGFGSTYLVRSHLDGQENAVKVMDKERFNRHEISLLEALRDSPENIVKIIDWKEDSTHYYMFMEYIPNSSVLTEVKNRSDQCIKDVALGLINALEYLHSRQISHQDIKPQNIIVDPQCRSILIDFGLSCLIDKGGVPNTYQPIHPSHLLLLVSDAYDLDEFDELLKLIYELEEQELIDLDLNSYTYLVREECMSELSIPEIRAGILNLVQLSQEADLTLIYDPRRRAELVTNYLKNEQVPEEIQEVLSDETLFGDRNYYVRVQQKIAQEPLEIAGDCDISPLKWPRFIRSDISLDQLKNLFNWLLISTIKHEIPIEVYLRAIDIILMVVTHTPISKDALQLLGVVALHLAERNYLLDIGDGINCLEIDFITADYPYAPPESSQQIRDYEKGDIYGLGISLAEWLTGYGEYLDYSKKYGKVPLSLWVLDDDLRKNTIADIKRDHPDSVFNESGYAKYQPIISRMTENDPRMRPSLSELRTWFTNLVPSTDPGPRVPSRQYIIQPLERSPTRSPVKSSTPGLSVSSRQYITQSPERPPTRSPMESAEVLVESLSKLTLSPEIEKRMEADGIDYQTLLDSRDRGGYLKIVLMEFTKDLGLKTSGTKSELVDHILDYYQ